MNGLSRFKDRAFLGRLAFVVALFAMILFFPIENVVAIGTVAVAFAAGYHYWRLRTGREQAIESVVTPERQKQIGNRAIFVAVVVSTGSLIVGAILYHLPIGLVLLQMVLAAIVFLFFKLASFPNVEPTDMPKQAFPSHGGLHPWARLFCVAINVLVGFLAFRFGQFAVGIGMTALASQSVFLWLSESERNRRQVAAIPPENPLEAIAP